MTAPSGKKHIARIGGRPVGDRWMPGPDHRASNEPREFRRMIKRIRQLPIMLGSPIKRPSASELPLWSMIRKSLVTLRPVVADERFTTANLGIKRPGTGLSPSLFNRIIGRRARRALPVDTLFSARDYGR